MGTKFPRRPAEVESGQTKRFLLAEAVDAVLDIFFRGAGWTPLLFAALILIHAIYSLIETKILATRGTPTDLKVEKALVVEGGSPTLLNLAAYLRMLGKEDAAQVQEQILEMPLLKIEYSLKIGDKPHVLTQSRPYPPDQVPVVGSIHEKVAASGPFDLYPMVQSPGRVEAMKSMPDLVVAHYAQHAILLLFVSFIGLFFIRVREKITVAICAAIDSRFVHQEKNWKWTAAGVAITLAFVFIPYGWNVINRVETPFEYQKIKFQYSRINLSRGEDSRWTLTGYGKRMFPHEKDIRRPGRTNYLPYLILHIANDSDQLNDCLRLKEQVGPAAPQSPHYLEIMGRGNYHKRPEKSYYDLVSIESCQLKTYPKL